MKLKQKHAQIVLIPQTSELQSDCAGMEPSQSYEEISLTDALDRLIEELIESDLLSDERFAESLIRSRLRRGYGPVYVRQELRQKGVNPQASAQHLEQAQTMWFGAAEEQIERRFPHACEHPEDWAKAARFLQRRGFDRGLISDVLGQIPDRTPEAGQDSE
ncbi:MAG: regulatory protein RecX [Pseudomonadota bacterium]